MQTSRKSPAQAANPRPKPATLKKPRTKKEQLVTLLRAKGGADIDQLTGALDWLPHTVRAALTGLRKSGLTIERIAGKGDSPARYRIAPRPERVR